MKVIFCIYWLIPLLLISLSSCKKDNAVTNQSANISVPVLTTDTVSSITIHTAVCGGTITSDGGAAVTASGVCWGRSHNPTIDSSKTFDSVSTVSFTSNITGLTASTTYFVRAYATNDAGTGYGSALSFTTYSTADTQNFVLQENKDAWACSCAPNANNYGVYPKLYQGAYGSCFARTYIFWDLSSLPQGITITQATMQLMCTSVAGTLSGEMVFCRILGNWDQMTITDKTAPSYTLQGSIVSDWPKAGHWLSVDVTDFVKFWFAHPESNFGMMGHSTGTTPSATGAVEFNNYQYSNSAYRPKLNIIYTTFK